MSVSAPLRVPGLLLAAVLLALGSSLIVSGKAPATVDSAPVAEKQAKAAAKSPAKAKPKKKTTPKKPVGPADYARWEKLVPDAGGLSDNGRWLAYTVTRVDKEQSLHLLDLEAKDPHKPVASIPQGGDPVFSKDSRWLVVSISKTPVELKKLKQASKSAGKPSSRGRTYQLRGLDDGSTTELKSAVSLRFSDDSGFAAIELEKSDPSDSKDQPPVGRALIVRNLKSGTDTTFGNVTKHAWSDRGSLLAMTVDSPGIGNTLQVFDPRRGVLRTLDSSGQDYASMSWSKDSMDLVVARRMAHGKDEDVSHVLLAWRNLNQVKRRASRSAMRYDHLKDKGFPDDMYVADGTPVWTKDGRAVLVPLREWEEKPKSLEKKDKAKPEAKGGGAPVKRAKPAKKPRPDQKASAATKGGPAPRDKKEPAAKPLRETLEEDSNVEVWHARDVEIMPLQKKKAEKADNPRRKAVWWPEKHKLVLLENDLTEEVRMLRAGNHAVGLDSTPHERTAMFGPELNDVYRIDITNGARGILLEKVQYLLNSSPDGAWLLHVRDGDVWSCEVETGKQRNLTGDLGTPFTDQQDDSLAEEKKPYSGGRWLADSSGVLLEDRFNVWLVRPDGTGARRLTDGDEKMVRHRISTANFTREDDGLLDSARPLYLSIYGERSKKSGYARTSLDKKPRNGQPEVLVWENRSVSGLRRAEENDRVYVFRKESFNDSPDLFLAGPDLGEGRPLTHTNTFQKDYLWGRSKLVNYVNDKGVELQGALIYPAGYRKGRTYPMVTLIYERLSQNLHRYSPPSETHPYNPSVFSAEGYFVLMPDIVYRPQEPGPSAVECIVPAVKAVLATGMVDPERVALIGHSWGAYQTAFTVTRSDVFAAAVAGAPLTDMMSMSMQVYWNSGNTNARIFSISQGRMDKPFWQDVDNYIRNSPIHGVDDLKTPLLVAFGDKDGAVDFSQGVEMYNAARLANKENYVMLVYPGENHGLRREENMVDYHYRILEWLAHYLKDRKAPKWITEGQSYLERKEEIDARKKEKKESGKKPEPVAK